MPDFTRHSNVQEEQVLEQGTLFKAVDMDAFDKAYAESKKITTDARWVPLYLKVGLFCNWSYKEFMETPYEVIKAINSHIDTKLENIEMQDTFLSWQHIFVTLAIAKCFGGGNR